MGFLEMIDLLLLGLIAAAVCYNCLSGYLAWEFVRAAPELAAGERSFWPPVSIIKPVAGMDEDSFENFATFCRQDYPHYEVIFAYSDPNDPVISVIQELRSAFPDLVLRLVEAVDNRGPNYKVGNLRAAIHDARNRTLAISDSDTHVGPDYLRRVVSELPANRPGLVTCLYRNIRSQHLGPLLQSLTLHGSFIPNVLFDCRLHHGLSYGFGATLCTTREALESIGGIQALQAHLADDYQIGYRLHRKGYPVRLSSVLIDHVSNLERFRDYFFHQLRWGVTQKVCRPGGYLASILIQSTVLAVLYVALHPWSPQAWLLFALVASIRSLTVLISTGGFGGGTRVVRILWLIPVNDLLNGTIWLTSLFTKTVRWRGRRLRVLKDGRMVETG